MAGRRVEAVVDLRLVLRAERVGGAVPRALQRLLQEPFEAVGCAERRESAECPLAVGRCRVDQDAGRRPSLAGVAAVDPFPDGSRRVAALHR